MPTTSTTVTATLTLAAALALTVLPAGAAATPDDNAAASASRPSAAAEGPTGSGVRVSIGFYVNSIREIDWKAGSFLGDLYWWIRYPRPAADVDQASIEALEFLNAQVGASTTRVQEKKVVPGPQGEEVYVAYRTNGRFYFDADFHKYPFDRQQLPIVIEHEVLMADDLVLDDDITSYARSSIAPARWGLGETVAICDLEIREVTRDFTFTDYDTDFGDTTISTPSSRFSRAILTIHVQRQFGPYLIKILIPLLIILVLAYLVFFIPAQDLEVAAGLTVTSLLAAIAFQFTVAGDLPDIGYVVTSDRIFQLSYLLVMLAMTETVITYNMEKHGLTTQAQAIERWSRVAYPAMFVGGLCLIIWHGLA